MATSLFVLLNTMEEKNTVPQDHTIWFPADRLQPQEIRGIQPQNYTVLLNGETHSA